MGDVIRLSEWRAARERRRLSRAADAPVPRAGRARVEFFFDLSCPFSYISAERVERVFDEIRWTPASTSALRQSSMAADAVEQERLRAAAERRAGELRLPLVWPEHWPAEVPAAMRAAAYAAEQGRGAAFVLAAGRLAFCGGFDLEDPEILAEAAAAAGASLDGCLAAAGDTGRDGAIESAGRRLLAAGVVGLPTLKVGAALFSGEHRVAEAAAAARQRRIVAG
jgi:2-hydroxychromene-2-carboxylate isomerase